MTLSSLLMAVSLTLFSSLAEAVSVTPLPCREWRPAPVRRVDMPERQRRGQR
ncbi:hypothetical protein GWD52_17405 [Enterobacteriaceae bacterium 4M9]|nr:hypothetical protein [Enterobacteriaceae bacterium 4M9]